MAILNVLEVFNGRSGSIDDKYARTYKRCWLVICDSLAMNPIDVRESVPVVINDLYLFPDGAYDNGVSCKKLEATQRSDSPLYWDVVAEYGSETRDPAKQDENPLNRPSVISLSTQQFQVPAIKDINNAPIVNSAGEPFPPNVTMIDDSRPILTVEKNVPYFDYYNAVAPFKDKLNTDTFLGFPPYTLKIFGISATSEYENGIAFWKKRVEMHFRDYATVTNVIVGLQKIDGTFFTTTETGHISGWDLYLLQTGSYSIVGGAKVVPIDSATGLPYSKPQLLDGNGALLVPPAKPCYETFPVYAGVAFANLGIS